MSIKLKPCPFCGSKAYFDIDDENWEWVECGSCGMQGNRSASLMEDCKPKLAEAWNRRSDLDLSDEQAEIARLLGALESARNYGSESWSEWLITEVDDALSK